MNMKKVAVLPLAVVAMGLASCNKAWPLVTDEESKTIAANILKVDAVEKLMTGKLSGLNDTATLKGSMYSKEACGKGIIEEETFNIVSNLNKSKNYYDIRVTASAINPEEGGKMSAESKMYYTYKDGYSIALNKEAKMGAKSVLSENDHKDLIKKTFYGELNSSEQAFDYLTLVGIGYKMLTNWNTYIDNLKTMHEQYKDDKNFYVNYETRSNNKTDSAQFILDAKTKKGVIPEPESNLNTESNYDYVINKVNVTYTNGIITKMSYTWEAKEEGADVIETNKATLDSITFGSASFDNINLDDYYIREE